MSDLTIYPAALSAMSVAELAALAPAELAEVSQHLEELVAWTKEARAKLDAALDARYGEQARAARLQAGKDFGVVHLCDGPLRVTADLPKRVEWDQPRLTEIVRRIRALGEDPEEYVETAYRVSETKFNAWPESLKSAFTPARTLKPGKPSFRLALAEEEAP